MGIAIDVAHASDYPTIDASSVGDIQLGKGPVLHRGANINPVLGKMMEKTAKKQANIALEGFVDLSALVIPETFIGAHIVGGLLLGIGFVMSGYCPGTALVSVASGYKDGLMALVGIMVGSLVFAAVYDPWLADFYVAGALGSLTFPEVLDVPWSVVVVGVTAIAITTFLVGEKVERFICARRGLEAPDDSLRVRHFVFAGLGAVTALGLVTMGLPASAASPEETAHMHVSGRVGPVALAQEISSGHDEVYIVDLRDPEACQEERIRGAMCLSEDDPTGAFIADLAPTRTLVLYAEGAAEEVPVSASTYGGAVVLLAGGFQAFERRILREPRPPSEPTREAVKSYEVRAALHGYFTGSEAPAAPVVARPTTVVRQRARRGGGC